LSDRCNHCPETLLWGRNQLNRAVICGHEGHSGLRITAYRLVTRSG